MSRTVQYKAIVIIEHKQVVIYDLSKGAISSDLE